MRGGKLISDEGALLQAKMNSFASNQPDVETHSNSMKRKFQANRDHVVALDNALKSAGLNLNMFVPKKRLRMLNENEERYHVLHHVSWKLFLVNEWRVV